jgi:glucose-6-phosphate 1-dehydrogenase
VLRAIPAVDPDRSVRGQYRGYTDIDGVAEDSVTETFVALRLEIDNSRWAGVPIFLRAGKALTERVTEVRLFTHRVPSLAFLPERKRAEPNQIVLRIDPDPGLRLQLTAINGDRWRDLHLDSSFAQDLGEPRTPYERLLHGALTGDHQLFAREDGIEETWRIVQPLLDNPGEIHHYEPGSWGPDEARELLRGHRGWQQPWLADNHH